MRNAAPILAAILMLTALPGSAGSADIGMRTLAVPSGAGAYGPRLTSGAGGIVLSWMDPDGATAALRYSRLADGEWQTPRTVVDGVDLFVNWADLPSVVAVSESDWAAHWLEMSGSGVYSYDVRIALSQDGGASWSAAVTPHRDGTATEHGFVSLYVLDGMLGALWLDGRDTVAAASHEEHGGAMTLRAARIDRDGGVHDEQLVDARVCDCCQTDVAATDTGLIAVYRDRTLAEIRDIHAVRTAGTRWLADTPLHDDGWQIAGCPVNGPAIAARQQHVAIAWFTAANDTPRVQLRQSQDGGDTFAGPVPVATDGVLGHVDAEVLPDGSSAVSWLAAGDGGYATLNLRRVDATGRAPVDRVIAHDVVARSVPQMVLDGDALVFAWTERHGEAYTIASARLPIAALQD